MKWNCVECEKPHNIKEGPFCLRCATLLKKVVRLLHMDHPNDPEAAVMKLIEYYRSEDAELLNRLTAWAFRYALDKSLVDEHKTN